MAQQLYAKIKRTSKYADQNETAAQGSWGLPFPVEIQLSRIAISKDYVVKGGPGGQYRLADVNLFVKCDDGTDLKIT